MHVVGAADGSDALADPMADPMMGEPGDALEAVTVSTEEGVPPMEVDDQMRSIWVRSHRSPHCQRPTLGVFFLPCHCVTPSNRGRSAEGRVA
jgi:hypothetical protein